MPKTTGIALQAELGNSSLPELGLHSPSWHVLPDKAVVQRQFVLWPWAVTPQGPCPPAWCSPRALPQRVVLQLGPLNQELFMSDCLQWKLKASFFFFFQNLEPSP